MMGIALWKIISTGGVVLVLVASCVARDMQIETRGADKAVAKIEKANKNAVDKGKRAADRSGAPGLRGVVDPSTRD